MKTGPYNLQGAALARVIKGPARFYVLGGKLSGEMDIIASNPSMESINQHFRLEYEVPDADTIAGMIG